MTPAPKITATMNAAPATIATGAAIRFSRLVLLNHLHRDRRSTSALDSVVSSAGGPLRGRLAVPVCSAGWVGWRPGPRGSRRVWVVRAPAGLDEDVAEGGGLDGTFTDFRSNLVSKTPAPARGAYRLTVRALGSDGQTDATPVSLTLRRR